MRLVRRVPAWLSIMVLIIPAEARQLTPQEQAQKLALGSKVVVTLKNTVMLKGRLGQVMQGGFTLEPLILEQPHKELLFRDIQKIGRAKDTWPIKDMLLVPVYLVVALGDLLWFGELPTP